MVVVLAVVNVYYADCTKRVEQTVTEKNRAKDFAYEMPVNATQSGTKLEETQELLEKVSTSLKMGDKENLKAEVSVFQERIQKLQEQVKEDSENTIGKLHGLGLETGVQRQKKYVEEMEKNFTQLEKKLSLFKEKLENSFSDKNNVKLAKEWQDIQNLYQPEQPQQATGEVLPHVNLKADSVIPSMKKGIIPAYGNVSVKSSKAGTIQPQPEDTVLSEETKSEDNVRALAETINTPVDIYEYVRNEIDFEPYYGSRKGASGTLYEKAGNDIDQASLMITLLRQAGYPARYVTGTVEVSIDKVMKWTGTSSAETAVELMASLGIPVTEVKQGGTIQSVRMEHTWTETYVPYEYYRGMKESEGESLWIPLDPSFKQYEIIEGLDLEEITGISKEDMQASVFGNGEKSADEYTITHVNNQKGQELLQEAEEKAQAYIKDNGLKDADVREIAGGKKIVPEHLGILPNVLPYKVLYVQREDTLIPNEQKETISFSIGGAQAYSLNFGEEQDFTVDYSAYELYGKRIILEWEAASKEDSQIIESYGGLDKTPSYLVRLIPKLKIDGEEAASGKPVQAGYRQQFTITMHHAGMDKQEIENPVIVGGIYAVGLDFGSVSVTETEERKAELESLADKVTEQNKTSDEVLGAVLDNMAKAYFAQLDACNAIIESAADVQVNRLVSEAMTGYQPKVLYLFQTPAELKGGSFYIDVDHDAVSVTSNSRNKEDETAYMLQAGMFASAMEHGIFEQTTGTPSVSTIKILDEANNRGIPIYTLGEENKDRINELQVSETVKTDVRDAIEGGKTVMIPQEEITYGEWNGSGYIVYDASTGAAGYMISGGIAGGSAAFDLVVTVSAVVSIVWAMVDMYMLMGLLLAAANPFLFIAYYSLIILTMWTIVDTMYSVNMYFSTGQYEYGLKVLGDLVMNIATLGLTKLMEKAVPAIGGLFKNIINRIDGTADVVARLGDDIAGAILKHGGDDALRQADTLVESIRGRGIGDDLIREVAEQGGVKGLDALEKILQKGVGKDTLESLLKEGYDLSNIDKLLDLGIHPSQYAEYGISNPTEARWIEYLIGGQGYRTGDIKYLAQMGIEPSNYKNLGIYGPEQAEYLVSLIKKVKDAGVEDDLLRQVIKREGAEGIEKAENLIAKGVDGATVKKLIKDGYSLDISQALLEKGISPSKYPDYGIKTPYHAERAKDLLVKDGHSAEEVKRLLDSSAAKNNIVKETKKYIDYQNNAGQTIRIPKQSSQAIDNKIASKRSGTDDGDIVEAKVADFIKNEMGLELTDFSNKVKYSSKAEEVGDIDCATDKVLIEIKSSISSVKIGQIEKYIDSSYEKYMNVLDKKVVVYVDKPMVNLNSIDANKLIRLKEMGVKIVNGLEELKGVFD